MRPICLFCLVLLAALALPAADIAGIWAGQGPSRRGEPEDVAFQFKMQGDALTGKMFGDEFDLTIEEGSVTGDQVKFTITTTNYYSGNKTKFVYSGVIKAGQLELTRERVPGPPVEGEPARETPKQTLKLKRLT